LNDVKLIVVVHNVSLVEGCTVNFAIRL
jgi:hypothetical protein